MNVDTDGYTVAALEAASPESNDCAAATEISIVTTLRMDYRN